MLVILIVIILLLFGEILENEVWFDLKVIVIVEVVIVIKIKELIINFLIFILLY